MAKGNPKNAGSYGAMDIGNYNGSQGPGQFKSMYSNLNMPQAVASGNRVGSENMYQQPGMQRGGGIGSMMGAMHGGMQGQPPQQGGMPGGMQNPSMMPSQGQMPDFMQMAMQRYQNNPANGMGQQQPMQPQMPGIGQGINEQGGMQPSPEILQQLLAQRGGGGMADPGKSMTQGGGADDPRWLDGGAWGSRPF
jgi:hypothetical protein